MPRRVYWGPKPAVLEAVPFASVHDFLIRRGYAPKPSPLPQWHYYEHTGSRLGEGQPLHYFFPDTDQIPDYPLSVFGFIEAQAKLWDLDPWDVLAELQGGPVARPVPAPVPA